MSFADIYERNYWGFGSGHGSVPAATKSYRLFLEEFIRKNKIRTVLDFGCGDWQFSRYVDWNGADYLGLDIVGSVIKINQQKFASPNIHFDVAPGHYAELPTADLLLVKDVLQHWGITQIGAFLEAALPKFKFALITNDAAISKFALTLMRATLRPVPEINCEIRTGGFRPLDLRRFPFGLKSACVLTFDVPGKFSWRKRWYYFGSKKMVLLVRPQAMAHVERS